MYFSNSNLRNIIRAEIRKFQLLLFSTLFYYCKFASACAIGVLPLLRSKLCLIVFGYFKHSTIVSATSLRVIVRTFPATSNSKLGAKSICPWGASFTNKAGRIIV